ncbi:MAG: pyridoxal phosphate-dependent aminotransferase [Proteobacteria bacterium]|nr:pyridoxal phosphate-dependent aminotransferase [Pseudomonadota bacterium]
MSQQIDRRYFDVVHDRRHTGAVKYDTARLGGQVRSDLIPMWVADMEFRVPPEVEGALTAVARHGIFGYAGTDEAYDKALVGWFGRRLGWEISPDWAIKAPGVMFGVSASIRTLSDIGDAVLICQPVYPPFASVVLSNDRQLVVSPLVFDGVRYEIDYQDFERRIVDHRVKVFLLCSPHNPVSRVWRVDELLEIGRICQKHGVYIISDDIHADLVLFGHRHVPLASLSEDLARRTITCTSPSKTFNLSGLQACNIIAADPDIRQRLHKICLSLGYYNLNAMAIAATRTVYDEGEPWLETLLSYLEENAALLSEGLSDLGERIKLVQPEGTYLMWLDCRGLGLSEDALSRFFLDSAGIWLNRGDEFGTGGAGFMRMNIACPQSVLLEAIGRLRRAVLGPGQR